MYDSDTLTRLKSSLEKRAYTDWKQVAFLGELLISSEEGMIPALAWCKVLNHMTYAFNDSKALLLLDDTIHLAVLNMEQSLVVSWSALDHQVMNGSDNHNDVTLHQMFLDAMLLELEDPNGEEEEQEGEEEEQEDEEVEDT